MSVQNLLWWYYELNRQIDFFQYQKGFNGRIKYDNGKWKVIDENYNYRFELPEMKNPLIDVICSCGWKFMPVISFKSINKKDIAVVMLAGLVLIAIVELFLSFCNIQ